jgi:hypothetical protein
VRAILRALEAIDSRLLRLLPGLGKYCGEVLVVAEK